MPRVKKTGLGDYAQEITKEDICKLKKPATGTNYFRFNDSFYSNGHYLILRDYANIPVEMQEMLYHKTETGSIMYFDAKLDEMFEKIENINLSHAGVLDSTNCSFEDTIFLKNTVTDDVVPISKDNYAMFKKYSLYHDPETNYIILTTARARVIGYCIPQAYNAAWEEEISALLRRVKQ